MRILNKKEIITLSVGGNLINREIFSFYTSSELLYLVPPSQTRHVRFVLLFKTDRIITDRLDSARLFKVLLLFLE